VGGDVHAWRLLNDKPVIVHGDGTSLWTLTHAEDFARYFARLLGNSKALGEAFHITADTALTWNDIFNAMGRAQAVAPRLAHVPTDTLIRYNADWTGPLLGDKTWSTGFDNSKVKSITGDQPAQVSIDEGFARVAPLFRARIAHAAPDAALNALLDRIAADQAALG
jgi:nucleoside-diphosphate-sugar epimerase